MPGPEADAEQFVRVWRAFSNIDNSEYGDCSGAEAPYSIKGIVNNVNAASAAPASSTAAATTAFPAAGACSLYPISTHGPPVDEGKESVPNDTTITKSLNSVKECISPSAFLFLFGPEVRWHFGLWRTRLRKRQRQQQHCCRSYYDGCFFS